MATPHEKTIYTIPAPYSSSAIIEVYGDPDSACYEWRIREGEWIVKDTGDEGHEIFRGRQYGQAEIALRDALMVASGMQDGYMQEYERVAVPEIDSPGLLSSV